MEKQLRRLSGSANPNNNVIGYPGEIYQRSASGVGTVWMKQSGEGTTTGWVQMVEAGGPSGVQPAYNFTTDGSGTYQDDSLIGGTESQFFLDGTYKAIGDGHSFDSATGTITISPDIADVAASFSYYL